MPYRKQKFINEEIYHIVIKRIGGEKLFNDIDDYFRSIFSIYEFNNSKSVEIRERRKARQRLKNESSGERISDQLDGRELLIEILCFCFMSNHLHLIVRQIKDGGIVKFMNKLGAGYAGYFKRKYKIKEKGYFFQGRFTSVHIKTEDQLKVLFVYVHTNPISLIEPKWKEKGIKSPQKAIKFLKSYKWSSYPDYIGKRNFPSVTERDFILKIMAGEKGCKRFVEGWLKYKKKIHDFPPYALEG